MLGLSKVLVATGILIVTAGTVVPQSAPYWRNTGSLNINRARHTATLLPNGKVLVAGGHMSDGTYPTSGALSSAELYDPVSEKWTMTGSLNFSRSSHAAVLLGTGKVLVVGGGGAESSAELYDPESGQWTVTGSLYSPKVQPGFLAMPGLVILTSGKVLAVGGGSAEIYDPASGTWAITGVPNTMGAAAKLLQNGKVLLFAQVQGSGSQVAKAELFDPTSGSWTLTGSPDPSFDHYYAPTLTLLPDGQVLAFGGQSGPPSWAELYNPGGFWYSADFHGIRRQYGHTATLMSNGHVMIVCGMAFTLNTTAVDLYDTTTGTWSVGPTIAARSFHTATLLTNSKVLVAGGPGPVTALLYEPDFEALVLTADQVAIKTWKYQGRTYVHVQLSYPNAGYRVTNWGQAMSTVNDFAADATVQKLNGQVQSVTTTAQIYDLGPLADGNYTFTFKNSGTTVKSQAFSVSSALPPVNPIDDAREFVKQQYRDFLNREADQAGEDFWTDNITKCSDPARRPAGQTEAQCTLHQRESTSAAFFVSPEFQYTSYFVYRMYKGALGRQPKLSEFIPDAQFVGAGIMVNGQLSGAKINQNKADFAQQFVNCVDPARYRCAEFKAIYDELSNQAYVERLFTTTAVGGNASASDRSALVNGLDGATETRASVLLKIVDGINVISEGNHQFTTSYGQEFYNLEFRRAFVQMEYFGYLKRDPDDAGYTFWLNKLNQFRGDFLKSEMVLAFISSPEYRARFGQP